MEVRVWPGRGVVADRAAQDWLPYSQQQERIFWKEKRKAVPFQGGSRQPCLPSAGSFLGGPCLHPCWDGSTPTKGSPSPSGLSIELLWACSRLVSSKQTRE